MGTSSLATSRLLYRSLPYAISDLAPVTLVRTFPLLMVAPNSSPAKSVAQFIAFARENKGKVTLASPGVGTVPHLAGELFKQISGIEMTHLPYLGDAPALADTMAGRVDLQIGGSAMLEQIRSGQVRGLAVATAKRGQLAPELPTVGEAGVPDFDVTGWFAFFVPARTSREIAEKIHIDTVTALSDPTVKAKLENVGMVAIGSTRQKPRRIRTNDPAGDARLKFLKDALEAIPKAERGVAPAAARNRWPREAREVARQAPRPWLR